MTAFGTRVSADESQLDPAMPFDHMVLIVEQDHTYDSYFRGYEPDPSDQRAGLLGLADDYVLFDHYFASSAGGTLGNMLDLTTGSTHGLLFSSKPALTALAGLDVPTLFDRLNDAKVDWRLYDGGLARDRPRKGRRRLVPGATAPPCRPRSIARRSSRCAAPGPSPTCCRRSSARSSSSRTRADRQPPGVQLDPSFTVGQPCTGRQRGREPVAQPRQCRREEQPVGQHGDLRHLGRRRRAVRQRRPTRRERSSRAPCSSSLLTQSTATSATSSTTTFRCSISSSRGSR